MENSTGRSYMGTGMDSHMMINNQESLVKIDRCISVVGWLLERDKVSWFS
jgi:hypothetical protein